MLFTYVLKRHLNVIIRTGFKIADAFVLTAATGNTPSLHAQRALRPPSRGLRNRRASVCTYGLFICKLKIRSKTSGDSAAEEALIGLTPHPDPIEKTRCMLWSNTVRTLYIYSVWVYLPPHSNTWGSLMQVTYTKWDHHGNTTRTQLFKMHNSELPGGPWPATAPCGDTFAV